LRQAAQPGQPHAQAGGRTVDTDVTGPGPEGSFARLNLVGADIVEVAPAHDHAQITGIAAAHVGYELLSSLAARTGR
jgi:agmatinase